MRKKFKLSEKSIVSNKEKKESTRLEIGKIEAETS